MINFYGKNVDFNEAYHLGDVGGEWSLGQQVPKTLWHLKWLKKATEACKMTCLNMFKLFKMEDVPIWCLMNLLFIEDVHKMA